MPHFIKIFKEHTELTPKKFRNPAVLMK
ncbi:hypothetical protein [Niallia taxi]